MVMGPLQELDISGIDKEEEDGPIARAHKYMLELRLQPRLHINEKEKSMTLLHLIL